MMSPSLSAVSPWIRRAVDHRAVRRSEVDDDVVLAVRADLGVAPADVLVVQRDGAFRQTPDRDRRVAERDALAGRQDERPATGRIVGGLAQRGEHLEATWLLLLIDRQLDLDGTHEVIALGAGVLPRRLDELALEHVGDLGEALEVLRGQLHREVVGDDAPALHIHGALIVHLAHEPAAELDGADVHARTTGEHAHDHTLQAAFQ